MKNNIELLTEKICSKEKLPGLLAYWEFKKYKIVFTNGCFDIIHRGHIEYLAQAANLGNVLLLGLNSDVSVKKIKGDNRPILDEKTRALVLASFWFINCIVLFDEETPLELIKMVQPDILVKGSDYNPEDIIGSDIVLKKGGEIRTIDFIEGYSTSSIIDKIANQ